MTTANTAVLNRANTKQTVELNEQTAAKLSAGVSEQERRSIVPVDERPDSIKAKIAVLTAVLGAAAGFLARLPNGVIESAWARALSLRLRSFLIPVVTKINRADLTDRDRALRILTDIHNTMLKLEIPNIREDQDIRKEGLDSIINNGHKAAAKRVRAMLEMMLKTYPEFAETISQARSSEFTIPGTKYSGKELVDRVFPPTATKADRYGEVNEQLNRLPAPTPDHLNQWVFDVTD